MAYHAKPTVLIVEDEGLIRMMAADVFHERGFTVFEAADAAAALEVFSASDLIDVLFTDVNMPGEMNGVDLAEALIARSPALHLIITSALPVIRPIDHLPATFVPKPYDVMAVCEAAETFLNESGLSPAPTSAGEPTRHA